MGDRRSETRSDGVAEEFGSFGVRMNLADACREKGALLRACLRVAALPEPLASLPSASAKPARPSSLSLVSASRACVSCRNLSVKAGPSSLASKLAHCAAPRRTQTSASVTHGKSTAWIASISSGPYDSTCRSTCEDEITRDHT